MADKSHDHQDSYELERDAFERDRMADLNELVDTLRRENEQLREQAFTDHLTQVFNRSGFELLMHEKWKELQRAAHDSDESTAFTLVCVDLDNFKGINDTYGHPAGDAALRTVADTLTARLRDGDIIGRFGGDEFVIGLLEADEPAALKIAEELVTLVHEKEITTEDTTFNCGISVGISSFANQPSWGQLYSEADQALLQAKRDGKGHVGVYDSAISDAA